MRSSGVSDSSGFFPLVSAHDVESPEGVVDGSVSFVFMMFPVSLSMSIAPSRNASEDGLDLVVVHRHVHVELELVKKAFVDCDLFFLCWTLDFHH